MNKHLTTLTKSKLASKLFKKNIYYKNEYLNPTGSHKDRECKFILEKNKKKNFSGVGCASTGNLAISLSYFSKIYNKDCYIWVQKKTPPKKVKILKSLKAKVFFKNNNLDQIYKSSNKFMKENKILNFNPNINKDKISANKEIAKEIFNQNKNIDLVLCTINNGSLFLGLYDYIKKFKNKFLVGVYTYSEKATSIRGLNLNENKNLLKDIKNNKHSKLIEAKDFEIKKSQKIFNKEKIFLEYDCSAMLVALDKIDLKKYKNICCVLSGNINKV